MLFLAGTMSPPQEFQYGTKVSPVLLFILSFSVILGAFLMELVAFRVAQMSSKIAGKKSHSHERFFTVRNDFLLHPAANSFLALGCGIELRSFIKDGTINSGGFEVLSFALGLLAAAFLIKQLYNKLCRRGYN